MSSPWFANRGQMLQAVAAVCAASVAVYLAYPSLEKDGYLSHISITLYVILVLMLISLYRGYAEKTVVQSDGTVVQLNSSGWKVIVGAVFGILCGLGFGGTFLFAGGQIIVDGISLGSGYAIKVPPPPLWNWGTFIVVAPSGRVAFGWPDAPNSGAFQSLPSGTSMPCPPSVTSESSRLSSSSSGGAAGIPTAPVVPVNPQGTLTPGTDQPANRSGNTPRANSGGNTLPQNSNTVGDPAALNAHCPEHVNGVNVPSANPSGRVLIPVSPDQGVTPVITQSGVVPLGGLQGGNTDRRYRGTTNQPN